MSKLDETIKTILIVGSGPIVIGQACEFDYSGTQAIKALKDLGYKVVLVNSNPATIMTDPDLAHRTYIEPITKEVISNIIKMEKVDAILPTMGGQTALNVVMKMHDDGMLDNVKFLGTSPAAIRKGEDRRAFREAMLKICMDLPRSIYVHGEEEAILAAEDIGFPLIIRASFTLGGGGSGIAYNIDEFRELVKNGLNASPVSEILIEEYLFGWKEYEMEVIRDKNDNCVVVCSIENVDPIGVHTGDSITVAPALTLTDKEYQRMRDASFRVIREVGVDAGGSNVQFAVNPANGRMTVIEMNPRVSRSSALASKATGYPIAKVATLLSVGYTLDDVKNDITGTPASFEPSIDYIVTKIPRFTFEKFPGSDSTLGTSMKSIGEVMAVGGTFKESLQKALCSLENDVYGLVSLSSDVDTIRREIRRPNEKRILYIADGFRIGLSVDEIYGMCHIDKWFLNEIREIVDLEKMVTIRSLNDATLLRKIKSYGFSDRMISALLRERENLNISESEVYDLRVRMGVSHSYNDVDTCSAEFESLTPYLYSSIGNFISIASDSALSIGESLLPSDEVIVDKVLIIGGGPNRIGQGIEFDYCCVHASFALKDLGVKSVMYNCNPETVSTDYDTSDILYFEPIDFERVRAVIDRERPSGVIVHFGGQTPLKLAKSLTEIRANIIGTSSASIDLAEDREKFSNLVRSLGLNQPENGTAFTRGEVFDVANRVGFPVLIRPSYVLGGRAIRIVYDNAELDCCVDEVLSVSRGGAVLIDKFLDKALELDVDCVSDGKSVYIGGISQHIEEAGIHSGDSACILPSKDIKQAHLNDIQEISAKISVYLGVVGLVNIQCAIHDDRIYLIEVNPRASRTVTFVSKVTGVPLSKVATRVMWNHHKGCDFNVLLEALGYYDVYGVSRRVADVVDRGLTIEVFTHRKLDHFSVKESVFPFNKLVGADLLLGPEMKSTGEVMGTSRDFGIAFLKSQFACSNLLPISGNIFMSLQDRDKEEGVALAMEFIELGFKIVATVGTHEILRESNIESKAVLKVSEGRPNINDMVMNREIDMIINTVSEGTKHDARLIRHSVLRANIPYFTTISGAKSAAIALRSSNYMDAHEAIALQDHLNGGILA